MLFEFWSCVTIVLPITCLSLPLAAQSLLNTTTTDAIPALNTFVHEESVLKLSDGTQIQCNISHLPNSPIADSMPSIEALSIDTAMVTGKTTYSAALITREGPISTVLSSYITSSMNTTISAATSKFGADPSLKSATVPNNPSTTPSANPDLTQNNSQLSYNDTNTFPLSNLTNIPICNPPLPPGQRQWPIRFADCIVAIHYLIGFRDPRSSYIFSRSPGPVRFYYHLPKKVRYGTCTIYLDMMHEADVDTVKLGDVTDTAKYLAYACSGTRIDRDRYGGHVTVGRTGRDLIVVWIHGRQLPVTPRGVGAGEAEFAN